MSYKKRAVIVGAAGDICSEVCRELMSENYDLLLIDFNKDKLSLLENDLKSSCRNSDIICFDVDVKDSVMVDSVLKNELLKFNPGVLINGVGGDTKIIRVEDLDVDYFFEKMEDNLITSFNVIKRCIPIMKKNKYGRIVNFASAGGRTFSHFNNAAYVASKAAVIGFTKQLAYEMAPFDITANVIAHGPMLTSRIKKAWEKRSDDVKKEILEKIPMHRMGGLKEAVGGVLYLASPSAGFTTGSVIDVNGGLYM